MFILYASLVAFVSSGSRTLRVCVSHVDQLPSPDPLIELNQTVVDIYKMNSKFSDVKIELTNVIQPSSGSKSNQMVGFGKLLADKNCNAVIGPSSTDSNTMFISHYLRQKSIPLCSIAQLGADDSTRNLTTNLISVIPSVNMLLEKIYETSQTWDDFQVIMEPSYISLVSAMFVNKTQIVLSTKSGLITNMDESASILAASKSNIVLFLGSPANFEVYYDVVSKKLRNTIEWVLVSLEKIEIKSNWKNVHVAYQSPSTLSNRVTCLKSFISFFEKNGNAINTANNFNAVKINTFHKEFISEINGQFTMSGDLARSWKYANSASVSDEDLFKQVSIADLRQDRGSNLLELYPGAYLALLVICYLFVIVTLLIGVLLRRTRQKKRSGLLDITTLIGIIIGNLYVFAVNSAPTDASCPVSVWFLPIAVSIILSTMIVRSYRLYRIFGGARLQSQRLSDFNLFLIVIAMVFVNVVVLLIWTVADPLKPTINYQYLQMQCSSEYANVFSVILACYNALLLLVAGFLANSTRKIISEYTESTQLAWCVYNVTLWTLISIPIQFTVGLDPMIKQIFVCVIVLLGMNIFTILLFGPSLLKTKHEMTGLKTTMGTTTSVHKINSYTPPDGKIFSHMADICEPGAVNMYKRYLVIVSVEDKYIEIFDTIDNQMNFQGRMFKLDLLDKLKMEDLKNGGIDITMDQTHLYIVFNDEELNGKFKSTIRPFVQIKQNANMQARL